MKEGIDGLLHDKTRPSRIPPLGPEVAARVVALTLADPPVETTHWTAIWWSQSLAPHFRSLQLTSPALVYQRAIIAAGGF